MIGKKTGEDELDFIREAGGEVMDMMFVRFLKFLMAEVCCLLFTWGVISLMSITVGLWVLTIGGCLIGLQLLMGLWAQWKSRRFIKNATVSLSSLNDVTDPWFE